MPGWDSIETVARLHALSGWIGLVAVVALLLAGAALFVLQRGVARPRPIEIAAVAILVLAIVAELLALTYGRRKDTLARETQSIRTAHAQKVATELTTRSSAELTALQQRLDTTQQRLDTANRKIAEFERAQALKRLSADEKRALTDALKPFAGQKIGVTFPLGDDEGETLAEDFATIFSAAGWDHTVAARQWDRNPVGIEIALNEDDARAGRVAAGVGALINVVRRLGLSRDNTIYMMSDVPPGQAEVRVGRKLRQ